MRCRALYINLRLRTTVFVEIMRFTYYNDITLLRRQLWYYW